MTKTFLYIDSIHKPLYDTVPWIVIRNYNESISYFLENGCPEFISFDYLLGDEYEKNCYDIVKWMIHRDLEMDGGFFSENFTYKIHSTNPIHRSHLFGLLNSYFGSKKYNIHHFN